MSSRVVRLDGTNVFNWERYLYKRIESSNLDKNGSKYFLNRSNVYA
jgi:hypothetical protein